MTITWGQIPLKNDQPMYISSGQHGKGYTVSKLGDLIVGRDRNVKLGDLRVFWYNNQLMWDTPVIYVAERKYRSIIPFRAPLIWWKRVELDDRLLELETFVDMVALADRPTKEIKQQAENISKKGFLRKLKGFKYE